MKKEHVMLSGLAIIVLGVITDRAISRGNLVRLTTPTGSLSFNEDNNRIRRIRTRKFLLN